MGTRSMCTAPALQDSKEGKVMSQHVLTMRSFSASSRRV